MRVINAIAIALVAAGAMADPPTLSLSLPARIIDGEGAKVAVTLRATGVAFTGPELHPRASLNVRIVPRSARSARCVFTETNTPSFAPTKQLMTLARGESATVSVDLYAAYPIGLGPGQYVAVAEYRMTDGSRLRSAPAEFSIDPPTAKDDAARYEAFLRTLAAVCQRESTAGEEALNFGRKYRDFVFTPALLSRAAMITNATAVRREIDAYLQLAFPNTQYADAARRDARYLAERDDEMKADEEHRQQIAAALVDPRNKESAAAFTALGTIMSSEGWNGYREFMRRYADSPFAPDVLYGMVVAAQKGIMPPENTRTDSDALVRELKSQLIDRYPASMRAKQLARTSTAH